MTKSEADRNLLFGILALQMDFIGRDDLVAAMHAWVLQKHRPLADLLQETGALAPTDRDLLEPLVRRHIEQHGGDPAASLAALSSVEALRGALDPIAEADADLHASLATLDRASPATASEGPSPIWPSTMSPSRVPVTASVGDSTSAGQRFRILRPHARGGLGEVYVAHDEELHREVALKQIQDGRADQPESRSRFLQEAEITGGLEHPGIVPVYGLGHYPDGRPYYAMRFIRGDSLKEAIERFHGADREAVRDSGERALALRQLLRRFVDVCNAVAYAHSRGVLHRDLKPGNVMLGPYGETLVIDWGLAKATGRREQVSLYAAGEATLVPPSGSGHSPTVGVLGSPPYMSPEQATGKTDSLGPATDVYGLGAILFALLTGEPPVEGYTNEEVLDRVRRGTIRPPRSLNPHIPRALEAVCLRALATNPADRYPSARALADDVERWMADEPVSVHREGWQARIGRWSRRHRTLVAGLIILLMTSAVALATSLVFVNQEREQTAQERNRAVQERTNADQQRIKAEIARADADRESERATRESKLAEQQRLKAEAAKADADRAALASFLQAADSSLATTRLLRYAANQPDVRGQALAQVQSAARLRMRAEDTLRASDQVAADTAREELQRWDERVERMRSEADHWLNDFELRRVREIALPSGESWPDAPALAVRDDCRLIALARTSSYENKIYIIILDETGDLRHRTTLDVPRQPGRTDSATPSASRLRFVAPDQVECIVSEGTYTWNLADGRVLRKDGNSDLVTKDGEVVELPGARKGVIGPGASGQETAGSIEIGKGSYILTGLPGVVTVRSREPGALPRTAWQASRPWMEGCQFLSFLTNERAFILISWSSSNEGIYVGTDPLPAFSFRSRLFLGDAATGEIRQATLGNGLESQVAITRVARFPRGLATLEVTKDPRSLRVALWEAVLPVVPTRMLESGGPNHTLDIAADGRIVSGGSDIIRARDRSRPLWLSGPPPFGYIPRVGGPEVVRLFGTYELFSFASQGSHNLVIQRLEVQPGGTSGMRTEILGAIDGRPLRPDAGYSLAITANFRYAVVVAEDLGTEWILDLWSPRTNRLLKRLGRYSKRRPLPNKDRRGIDSGPFFSPGHRWLFIPTPDGSGRGIEFWRLPDAERVGTAAASLGRLDQDVTVDPEETHVVRIGGQVFDLLTCKKRCDLDPVLPDTYANDLSSLMNDLIITDENMMIGTDQYGDRCPIHAWDLTTGKKSVLGDTKWSSSPTLRLLPDGSRMLAYGFVAPTAGATTASPSLTSEPVPLPTLPVPRVTTLGPQVVKSSAAPPFRVELWDIPQRRQLRQVDLATPPSRTPSLAPAVLWDSNSFYIWNGGIARPTLPDVRPGGPQPSQSPSRYAWSNGEALPGPSETPVSHVRTLRQSFPPFLSPGVADYAGALWRGRDGLTLQVGWDPVHKPLVGSMQLPLDRFVNWRSVPILPTDNQAHLLILPYAYFTKGVSGQWPQTTDIWDSASGRRILSLPASETFAAIDPNGAWLASVDYSAGVIKIYEAASGRVAHRVKLNGLPGGVKGLNLWASPYESLLRLHPRGDRLVVCHLGVMYLWDAAADRALCRVDRPVHFTAVERVAQSPASRLVASGGADGVILLTDRDSGRFLRDLVGHFGAILSLAFDPGGDRLASSAQDGTVILWDVAGKPLWTYRTERPGESATSIVFDRTGATLFIGTSAGRMHRLDLATGKPVASAEPGTGRLQLALCPSGKRLILTGASGKVHSWDAPRNSSERSWDAGHSIDCVVFVSEEVVATGGKTIEFWDVTTGRRLMSHELPRGAAVDMRFDEKAGELLVADKSNEISVINLREIDQHLGKWGLGFLHPERPRDGH